MFPSCGAVNWASIKTCLSQVGSSLIEKKALNAGIAMRQKQLVCNDYKSRRTWDVITSSYLVVVAQSKT